RALLCVRGVHEEARARELGVVVGGPLAWAALVVGLRRPERLPKRGRVPSGARCAPLDRREIRGPGRAREVRVVELARTRRDIALATVVLIAGAALAAAVQRGHTLKQRGAASPAVLLLRSAGEAHRRQRQPDTHDGSPTHPSLLH